MIFYRIISIVIYPLLLVYLFWRLLNKKEDKKRFLERLGKSSVKRPEGHIVWLHAVSVGEANSAMVLIEELLNFSPKITILFTTTTLTSAAILDKKLPEFKGRVLHQFLPIDSYFCVKSFFDFWKPRVAIFVESEIWPNLVFEARNRGILSFLVNARMSEKSFKKWHFAKKINFNIFDYFAAIFVQMVESKERFAKLTKQEVLFYGNLKSQARNLSVNFDELEKIKTQIGGRKMWLAASTHKGEEEYVIAAHKKLKSEFPDLLTILVLRHPNRAEEVKALLRNFKIAQRSVAGKIEDSTEIYLVDTLGEMGIFYSLCNFSFIGGSLFEIGGHNPFEPIKLGCAVISGRGVFNFKEIYEKLERQNACVMLDSGAEIAVVVKKFFEDTDMVKSMSGRAFEVIESSENIARRVVVRIDQLVMLGV